MLFLFLMKHFELKLYRNLSITAYFLAQLGINILKFRYKIKYLRIVSEAELETMFKTEISHVSRRYLTKIYLTINFKCNT